MLIDDLIPYALSAVNGPGGSLVSDDDDDWAVAIANAFWTARLRGFFKSWRVDADNIEIVPVDPGSVEEFDREAGQVIVLFAAMNVLEAKLAGLATKQRAKAGPVESETQRSATLLTELLKARRRELDEIASELSGRGSALVAFCDMVADRIDSNGPTWLN